MTVTPTGLLSALTSAGATEYTSVYLSPYSVLSSEQDIWRGILSNLDRIIDADFNVVSSNYRSQIDVSAYYGSDSLILGQTSKYLFFNGFSVEMSKGNIADYASD